ncbi:death domain-associated protein 6-like [Eriocheir sinensis]|uniref:death domain-associated protein 6-like n=1 Tax=Eriocheir sinensis TaxID=95602 RepID=UPI0021C5F830|nr:death domain-associated protein 6-like [Eriocheir sinensis]
MAAREVVDVISSDEEFLEPPRKPIGWNFQLGLKKEGKTKKSRANGVSAATASASHDSTDDSDDDLEIIEVKVEPQKKVASLLPSSSRSEIRKQVRNTTQSSISDFFSKPPKADKGSNKESKEKEEERLKKEEYEIEEDDDKSSATMEAFMRRWEEINNLGKDDKKIRDKLWKYYHLAHTSYTHSKKFIQIVEASIDKLTISNTYVIIKDLLDSLKRYKDSPFREKLSEEESAGTSREGTPAPIEVEDSKTNRKLKKIDKMMKEIAQKIKDLENQEVDLDDEVNSTYLVEERLKRQFTKLHSYYCRLANCSPATGRPTEKKFKFRGSRWQEINKRITAWVNKHKEFPDYTDILNLVKKVTQQSSLPLRPETVRVQAQEIFRDVGKMLKYRRESDDLYSIYSYADEEGEDPALEDEELNDKLKQNEKAAEEKLNKIFQEYVDKEAQQREEADTGGGKDKTSKSSVKEESDSQDPSRTVETQEGESSKLDDKERDKVSVATTERQGLVKNDIDTDRQSDGTTSFKNEEEGEDKEEEDDSVDDMEQDTSDNEEGTSDDDEDDHTEDEDVKEEEESEPTQEQTSSEVKKEDLDLDDETDDELKDVLASACRDEEEEEDSEEDIPVLDSEELLQEESRSVKTEESNSITCLDEESPSTATPASSVLRNSVNGPPVPTTNTLPAYSSPTFTTAEDTAESHPVLDSEEVLQQEDSRSINSEESNSIMCLDDESKDNSPAIGTHAASVFQNSSNGPSVPTSNSSPATAASTAHSSSSSTTAEDMAELHQKRHLEDESSPACKKICLESPKS